MPVIKEERFTHPMVREPSVVADRKVRTPDEPSLRLQGDLMDFWGERISAIIKDPTDARRYPEIRKGEGLLMVGDTIYSYGRHFPMAVIHRHPNGRARRVLVNGDTYSGATGWGHGTSGQQAGVRGIVRRECAALGIDYIIIPFSALDAAGIDRESIIVLDSKDDVEERRERTSEQRPGPLVRTTEDTGHTREGVQKDTGWHIPGLAGYGTRAPEGRSTEGAIWGKYLLRENYYVKPDTAEVKDDSREPNWWPRGYAELQDDGSWRWEEVRHRLGESLFKAKVKGEGRRRPASDEETAQQLAAEKYRHEVVRPAEYAHEQAQGVVGSAVSAKLIAARGGTNLMTGEPIQEIATDAEIERLKSRCNELHQRVAELREKQPPFPPQVERTGDRLTVFFTVDRWAKFLSSYDYNEPHRPYFMCELRYRSPANTLEEAFEDLKPDDVYHAEALGIEVLRQGDVFAIPAPAPQDDLNEAAKTKMVRRHDNIAMARVLGTNHSATHVLRTEGLEFGRGMLYHDPQGWGRTADHRRVKLGDGKTWYRLVKNTVPLDKASGSSRGSASAGTLNQSGQSRAWMLGGAVD